MDGAGRLRRGVARDAARKRELLEEPLHALGVWGDVWKQFRVRTLQIRVRHHAWSAMTGTADVDHVEIVLLDDPVAVRINEIQAGRGAPMTQQPWLDMFQAQRLGEQRVVEKINLSDGQVVGGA